MGVSEAGELESGVFASDGPPSGTQLALAANDFGAAPDDWEQAAPGRSGERLAVPQPTPQADAEVEACVAQMRADIADPHTAAPVPVSQRETAKMQVANPAALHALSRRTPDRPTTRMEVSSLLGRALRSEPPSRDHVITQRMAAKESGIYEVTGDDHVRPQPRTATQLMWVVGGADESAQAPGAQTIEGTGVQRAATHGSGMEREPNTSSAAVAREDAGPPVVVFASASIASSAAVPAIADTAPSTFAAPAATAAPPSARTIEPMRSAGRSAVRLETVDATGRTALQKAQFTQPRGEALTTPTRSSSERTWLVVYVLTTLVLASAIVLLSMR